MARRTVDIQIKEQGRDQGKLFKITEMSAFDTEKWAERVINAVLRNADPKELALVLPWVYSYIQQVNDEKTFDQVRDDADKGKAAIPRPAENLSIYFASTFFKLPYDDLKLVSDPLLKCCSIYLNPAQMDIAEPVLNNPNQYIEEPSTILALKREVFKLHTDFFLKATIQSLSTLAQ